jgi:hypothetical protein
VQIDRSLNFWSWKWHSRCIGEIHRIPSGSQNACTISHQGPISKEKTAFAAFSIPITYDHMTICFVGRERTCLPSELGKSWRDALKLTPDKREDAPVVT